MNYQDIDSPIGRLRLIADGDRLVSIWFEHGRDAARAAAREPLDLEERSSEVLERTREQLEEYFAGRRQQFDLPLDPRGTDFQRRVWQRLRSIAYGETTTYGALARELGDPGASRAVGLANGSNPLPIVIPCHRVIGAGGALTGYAGGLDRKVALLELDRRDFCRSLRRGLLLDGGRAANRLEVAPGDEVIQQHPMSRIQPDEAAGELVADGP